MKYVSDFVQADIGGTVQVTDPQSPMFGASITIPPGALASDTEIFIEYADKGDKPPLLPLAQPVLPHPIVFGPEGTQFNVPVIVTMPYYDSMVTPFTESGISTYLLVDGAWSQMDKLGQNQNTNRVFTTMTELIDPHVGIPLGNRPSRRRQPSLSMVELSEPIIFADDYEDGIINDLFWQFEAPTLPIRDESIVESKGYMTFDSGIVYGAEIDTQIANGFLNIQGSYKLEFSGHFDSRSEGESSFILGGNSTCRPTDSVDCRIFRSTSG